MGTYTSTLVLTVTYTYNFASHLKSSFILMNESCKKQHIFRNIRFSVLETIKFSEFTPTYEHSSQSYYLGRWNHSRSIVSLLHLAQCTCWYKYKNLTIFVLKCINDFNCYNINLQQYNDLKWPSYTKLVTCKVEMSLRTPAWKLYVYLMTIYLKRLATMKVSINGCLIFFLSVYLRINIYHWMAPDSKNDKTLTLVKTHFMS